MATPPHDAYRPPQAPVEAAPPEAGPGQRLAGRGRRFLGMLVDLAGYLGAACVVGFTAGVVVVAFHLDVDLDAAIDAYPDLLVFPTLIVPYHLFFEGLWGRTPGKWLLGMRVVDAGGEAPGLLRVAGRTALRFVPFDAFSFLFTPTGWHDRLSGTRVVRTR